MTKRILLTYCFIVLILQCYAFSVPDSTITISGKVVDSSGGYLPYVKISVEGDGVEKDSLALTDGNGEFSLQYKKQTGSCVVNFSYLGFRNRKYEVNTSKDRNLGEVRMEEDEIMLEEIVVNNQIVSHQDGRSIYFPTTTQRKASNNAGTLLYNMMIPEINIDRLSGNAMTKDGKTVTLCINGVAASADEVRAVRQQDIIRVDFYASPTGVFSMYDAVVDIVVRTYESGGYATVNTSSTFLTPQGKYDFSSKYHRKRWNYNAFGGFGFIKDTQQHSLTEENINLSPAFCRTSETDYYYWKNYSSYGALRANYSHGTFYASAIAGLNWNKVPDGISVNKVSYSTKPNDELRDSTYYNNRSLSPYIKTFVRWQCAEHDYLVVDASYSYADNSNMRSYTETNYAAPIVTTVGEDSHHFNGSLYYWHNFKAGSYISTGLTHKDSRYKDDYVNVEKEHQVSSRQDNSVWVKYKHYLTKDWFAMLSTTVVKISSTTNGNALHEWKWSPSLQTEYSISKTSKLSFNGSISYLSPSQSMKTMIRQTVNTYERLQGNDSLKNYNNAKATLAYTKYWNKFNLYADISGVFYSKSIQDNYFAEQNLLIHSFQQEGSYSFTGANLWATAYLLNRSLQIQAGGCYQIVHSNDIYRKNLNSLFWGVNALYSMGNLSLSAYYNASGYGSSPTSSEYRKGLADYGVAAIMNMGNMYLSLSASNFFNKQPIKYSYLMTPIYQRITQRRNRSDMASINLTLTYTLDFGHKKQEREEIQLDTNINSGILRVE